MSLHNVLIEDPYHGCYLWLLASCLFYFFNSVVNASHTGVRIERISIECRK